MTVLCHLGNRFLIKYVQFTHIPRLPRLVPPTVVDDRRLLPHVLQRHAVPVISMERKQLFRHIVADGVQGQDALPVQGADDVRYCDGHMLFLPRRQTEPAEG